MQHHEPPLLLRQQALQGRGKMYHQIRDFFFKRGVLEVETPIFSQAGNPDPTVQNLIANFHAPNSEALLRYAHTSPEFAMKRLLAEGIGSIYQICKVFRLEECGRLHNPEFSMLEWYRPGLSYLQLMDEVEELLQTLEIASACTHLSYRELFTRFLDLDVFDATLAQLKSCAQFHKLVVTGMRDERDEWRDLLLSHLIEPKLKTMGAVFIYDYPASQAALANIRPGKQAVAERFELYLNGIELANGYQELIGAEEYRRRFTAENKQRERYGLDVVQLDENLLQALGSGLPACSGVAMGLDRLLMRRVFATKIQSVLSFDFDNA